ncbi:AAA family ATPase [Sphingobacterium rhinopitheci]|uniref:AAA family ATPase n=1 Tax=Sphingobacterium rhinopitheci TaxID=2781960 RepID=UPI001F529C99|nr:ATP-binding protein [Sphingobacterium rhinopitheci]MCI0922526.1 ATP-binding protein [Sphingobacterium rhinopitheci]
MLQFDAPEVTSFTESNKPLALANKGYPYHQIPDDRRFEELIYSIYKIKIDQDQFKPYDSISILTGVRDKGRDCVLYKDGKANGVIQCKLYKNPYSKNELGLEITKFILYSIIDERLVDDYSSFSYYICTANGLANECNDFVKDFQNIIANEPQLSTWINKCLAKSTLESLKIDLDITSFKEKISKITVKNIYSQDLDLELSSPILSHLIPLFFEVKTVIDASRLDELKNLIKPTLTYKDVINALRTSSVSLSNESNEFSFISNSHLVRKETELLYDWIINDNNKSEKHKNICLLVGSAGYGKTVILKDLYDKCVDKNVAVLGLKADILYSTSINDLQKNISTPIPLLEFIKKSKKHFSKVVILIDQIDALSQSMSSDRRFLNVFRNFIDIFLDDENVKIILSVRPYELNYDPSLQFYKNGKTIDVNALDELEVNMILRMAKINPDTLSSKLLQLLKIPNQLDVFLQIATNGTSRIQSISLHGLYFELWNQKVTEIAKRTTKFQDCISVKKLLYTIANDMYAKQRISIPRFKYEDYQQELNYLMSERLIKTDGNQIQFFHQSFYDFVFSKQLVEQDTNIIRYIKDAEQSIHIRSAVKMTFTYLREYEFTQYLQNITSIFDDDEVLFHIKQIIFSLIISLDTPHQDEISFVKTTIKKDIQCELLFLEMTKGEVWFNNIVIELGYLDLLKADQTSITNEIEKHRAKQIFYIIQSQITTYNSQIAWEILSTITDKYKIQDLLYSVTEWSNPLSYQIFESCKDFEEHDPFGYYHVLDNMMPNNPEYVVEQLSRNLPKSLKDPEKNSDYKLKEVLKKLINIYPDKLYSLLLACVISDLQDDNRYNVGSLISDWTFHDIDLTDNEDYSNNQENPYQLLGICLKKAAEIKINAFLSFLDQYKHSKYESILRLIIFALQGNEVRYVNQIYNFFITVTESKIIEEDKNLEHELRILIASTFALFSSYQKQNIINYIKQYKKAFEISSYEYGEPNKKRFYSNWGLGKYFWLKSLPMNLINSDKELKKSFQELERRHKNIEDKPNVRQISVTIGCTSPVNPKAYPYMSKEQWIAAFRKYNSSYIEDFGSNKGGIHELSSGFSNTIRENPSDMKMDILKAITNDPTININYVFTALQTLAEIRKDLRQDLIEILKTTIARKEHTNIYYPIKIAGILSGGDTENPYLITLLTVNALNYEKKGSWQEDRDKTTDIHGLVTHAMNTYHGSAISALVRIKDNTYENLIFETVESILVSGPPDARALVYYYIAHLTRMNIDRTNKLFVNQIAKEDDIYVIASSLWSLQYLRKNGFKTISPAYEKLIVSNLIGKNDAESLFNILYGSYLHNIEGADELLFQLIKYNGTAAVRGIRTIFKNYYTVANSKEKNDNLLLSILQQIEVNEENDLSINFINIEHIKLIDIYPFLLSYIKSPIFMMSNYLVEYLCEQCAYSPLEAIDLFDSAFENRASNNQRAKGIYKLDESYIKFIVGAYDSLTQKTEIHSLNKKRLLQRFDDVLQDYKLRRSSYKILDTLT